MSNKNKEKEKVNIIETIKDFFNGVIVESKRVQWTSRKELLKYSISTFVFVFFFSLFFYGINILFAFLHSLVK